MNDTVVPLPTAPQVLDGLPARLSVGVPIVFLNAAEDRDSADEDVVDGGGSGVDGSAEAEQEHGAGASSSSGGSIASYALRVTSRAARVTSEVTIAIEPPPSLSAAWPPPRGAVMISRSRDDALRRATEESPRCTTTV